MAFTGPFEDRLAIHELILSYADAINTHDGEAWISCWAEDAEWNLPMIPGMETTKGRTADEYGSWLLTIFDYVNIEPERVTGAVISSVVPSVDLV